MRHWGFLISCLFLVLAAALPAAARTYPVYASRHVVVSAEATASDIGLAILEQGGNAFDAAAAVGFALAVTYPQAGNLGGGGFCLALPADDKPFALDFRETAPGAFHRDIYLDENGDVIPGRSAWSHFAIGVPGTVDGLLRLQKDHGRLSRDDVLAPAVRLARDGFTVGPALHFALGDKRERLAPYPAAAAVFLPGEAVPAIGTQLVQKDLAATLDRIRKDGRDGFYRGRTAELLLAEMARHDAPMTERDLRDYRAVYREPFSFRAGDLEVLTPPLPSSGGIVIAQALKLLDFDWLRTSGWNSADYVHRVTEALRLAYADRNHHLGDPAFSEAPVEALVSEEYLRRRARLLPIGSAGRSDGVDAGTPESSETTHFTVVDGEGNVVAITYTLNSWFGLGAVVPDAGFFLNNEMDDFSSKPGVPNQFGLLGTEANAVGPGKRPLSSMTPTIVRKDGQFWMTVGSPGGSRIITTVLQVILNCELFDMNIRDAIDSPRFHHQWWPDRIDYEPRAFSADTVERLEAMGYPLHDRGPDEIGRAVGVLRTTDGMLTGWPDRRTSGKAVGR